MHDVDPDLDNIPDDSFNPFDPTQRPAMEMEGVLDSLRLADDAGPPPGSDVLAAGPSVVGTPDEDAEFWQPQTTPFTCAVMAQCGIIHAFTGDDVSEAQLVYDATVNGYLTDAGMSPADVGKLLDLYGIPNHQQQDASIGDLVHELSQGHKVIVGVDSGELWNQDYALEDFFRQAADHAIWVSGVDFSDPASPKVYVNDSGDPEGGGKAYDLDLFVDAWQDSGFFYVATDEAPPDFHLAASGFDPASSSFPDLVDRLPERQPAVQGHGMDLGAEPGGQAHTGPGTCPYCGGAGGAPSPGGENPERCWYCDGTGVAV